MATSTVETGLVPELLVTDTRRSLEFWCGLCGFQIDYERPDEGFARISLGSAGIMLEQRGVGRNWITGPLENRSGGASTSRSACPDYSPYSPR